MAVDDTDGMTISGSVFASTGAAAALSSPCSTAGEGSVDASTLFSTSKTTDVVAEVLVSTAYSSMVKKS